MKRAAGRGTDGPDDEFTDALEEGTTSTGSTGVTLAEHNEERCGK